MTKRETKRAELERVQRWLTDWREEYGGRGRPIPEDLWEAAAEIAATQGVSCTARKLGLDRGRLGWRMAQGQGVTSLQKSAASTPKFVELGPFIAHTEVVVHITGQGGKGLQMSIQGSASDVALVIRELWGHAQ